MNADSEKSHDSCIRSSRSAVHGAGNFAIGPRFAEGNVFKRLRRFRQIAVAAIEVATLRHLQRDTADGHASTEHLPISPLIGMRHARTGVDERRLADTCKRVRLPVAN